MPKRAHIVTDTHPAAKRTISFEVDGPQYRRAQAEAEKRGLTLSGLARLAHAARDQLRELATTIEDQDPGRHESRTATWGRRA